MDFPTQILLHQKFWQKSTMKCIVEFVKLSHPDINLSFNVIWLKNMTKMQKLHPAGYGMKNTMIMAA